MMLGTGLRWRDASANLHYNSLWPSGQVKWLKQLRWLIGTLERDGHPDWLIDMVLEQFEYWHLDTIRCDFAWLLEDNCRE